MSYLSDVQVDDLCRWLSSHGFRTRSAADSAEVEWRKRGHGHVRLAGVGTARHVEVQHPNDPPGWTDLDELVARRSEWPEALTMSRIELATAPILHARADPSFRQSPGAWLYRWGKPKALFLKVVLQMLIGLGAAIDIGIQAARFTIDHPAGAPQHAAAAAIIHVIAYALAVAAAIELAYTLYTPGPDEALDPLTLGLSSGILLLITQDGPAVIAKFAGILLGAVALGALFFIRHRWVADEDS